MCTAVSYAAKDHYFGRNLDLEYSYEEKVTIMPRRFPLYFRNGTERKQHYSIIGMAHTADGYPLYYDAVNEKGLAIAGLNFPKSAVYHHFTKAKENICPFEVIPWLLANCATLKEARHELERMNIADESFSPRFPNTPLHWMITDFKNTLVIESVRNGLQIHDDPAGVLTNEPPFETQMMLLNQHMSLSDHTPEKSISELPTMACSLGMGAIGLPGDYSSLSRFVRASFVRNKSRAGESEEEAVSQFFHILASVEQPRGCTHVRNGRYEITRYSSCCNQEQGIYYYRTYENSTISAVYMHHENLEGDELIHYPLIDRLQINHCN